MSADDIVTIEVWLAAIPATLFAVFYPFLARSWFRTWIGRALLASSCGLALLLDLSLVGLITHRDYLHRDAIRITIMAIVVCGAVFKLVALLRGAIEAYDEARERWDPKRTERYEEAD